MSAAATPFARIVEASGLSPIFGPTALKRALSRVGVSAERASVDELRRALPELEKALGVFMTPSEVTESVRRIRAALEAH